MPRRRELLGVADQLTDKFLSRNNDFNGYWAVGQLHLHALNSKCRKLEFDLLSTTKTSAKEIVTYSRISLADWFQELLSKRQIPTSWIREAKLTVLFDADSVPAPLIDYYPDRGELFLMRVDIVDDLGTHRSRSWTSRCKPHDPEAERRRLVWLDRFAGFFLRS